VNANNSAGRYPGWFGLYAEVIKGKDRAKVEQIVLRELKKLRDEPISEAELKRAQQGILANTVFGRESVPGLAHSIAQGVTVADLDSLKNSLPRVLAVTAKDVQRVAKEYFDPEKRVTVWSVPPKGDKGGALPAERGTRSAERGAKKAEGKAGT